MNALNAAQRMQMIEKFETLTIKEYGALVSENEQLRQRVAELEKVAELKRDSERYIWLISQESWEPPRDALPKWYGGKIKWLGGDYSIDEINEIIDKARCES